MSFDTLAPYYRGMEILSAGGILQRCRTAFLSQTAGCQRALLLGEGPGRFLVELLRVNPRVEVTCVEQSSRMIVEARRAVKRNGLDDARVKFQQLNALTCALTQIKRHRGGFAGREEKGSLTHGNKTPEKRWR